MLTGNRQPISLYLQEDDSDVEDKTSAESSDSGSDFSSDIYSLTLNEAGPEMVVLGTLRKVCALGQERKYQISNYQISNYHIS